MAWRMGTERSASTAISTPVGSSAWLVQEILAHCGEAVVVEPADLRALVARRSTELVKELGLSRVRSRTLTS